VSLVKNGYNVTLLCNDDLDNEIISGVNIEKITIQSKSTILRILKAPKAILHLAILINADIYQLHDPELLPVGLKLKKMGKKVIYDSHEDFPRQILEKEWIPIIFRRILSVIAEAYLTRAIKKFDAVLTVTPHIVDILKKSTKNVYQVTNYPILEDKEPDFSLGDYLLRENQLCYSGTVYSYSLQEKILESIAPFDNLMYVIVGSLDARLYSRLANYKSWSKVQYIEKVPKAELIKIYKKVTIGIVLFSYSPNMGDNLGTLGNNKIFEYMYYGLPIICTDFILWKEIIDKYRCGIYVNPGNVEEIRNAITYLTENKKEAYDMGQTGKHTVIEEYNWDSQERKYIDIVRKVTSL